MFELVSSLVSSFSIAQAVRAAVAEDEARDRQRLVSSYWPGVKVYVTRRKVAAALAGLHREPTDGVRVRGLGTRNRKAQVDFKELAAGMPGVVLDQRRDSRWR